jgi:hypothetical protein
MPPVFLLIMVGEILYREVNAIEVNGDEYPMKYEGEKIKECGPTIFFRPA